LQTLVLLATGKKLREQAALEDDFLHIFCVAVKKPLKFASFTGEFCGITW